MSVDQEQMLMLLQRIANALEASAPPAVKEGFSEYGKTVFCNIAKGNGDGWYTLCEGLPITQQPVFCGRILSLSFPTVKRREQDVRKFHLVMQAGDKVVTFESGHDCFFSKTVLSALAMAEPEVLARPIQLASFTKELRTGDSTLTVSLRDSGGNKLSCDWSNNYDWKAIATVAIANVEAALEYR